MKFRSTYILVAIALALGLFIYFHEIRGSKTREEAKEREKKVFDVKADDISWVEITRLQGEPLRIERVGGASEKSWRIVKPIEARADDGAVGSITWQLADLSFSQVAQQSPSDLSAFGLSTPELTVKFGGAVGGSGKEWAIEFGKKLPVGSDSYSMVPGQNRVIVLSQAARSTFDKQTIDLRDKRILIGDDAKLSALEITTPESAVKLEKFGGAWKIASIHADADEDAVKKILDDLHSLEAKEFLPAIVKESLGLGTPELTVTLVSGADRRSRQTVNFYRGREADIAYAQPEGDQWLYKIAPDIIKNIPRPVDEFRVRKVLKFERYDVEQVRIKPLDGAPDIVIAKNDAGDWEFVEPNDFKQKALGSKVYDFLDSLENLRAVKFVDAPPPEKTMSLKAAVILYKSKGEEKGKKKSLLELGTLWLGGETAGNRYARGTGSQIFLIDSGFKIPSDPKSLTAGGGPSHAPTIPSPPTTPELDEEEE